MRVVPPPQSRPVALDGDDRTFPRELVLEAIGSRVIEAFGFVTDALLQLLGLLGDAVEPLLAFAVAFAVGSVHRGDIVDETVQSALVARMVLEEEVKVGDKRDAVASDVACTVVEDEVDAEEDGFPIQDAARDDENDNATVRSSTCGEVVDQEAIIATIAASGEGLSMAPADDTLVTARPARFPGFMEVEFDLEKFADARKTRPSRRIRTLDDPSVLEGMALIADQEEEEEDEEEVESQSNVSASMSVWCVTAAKCHCSCTTTECIVAMDVADGWRDFADMHVAAEFHRDSLNETKLQQLVVAVAMFNETLRLDASTIAFMARDLERVGNDVDAALIRISTMSTIATVPPSPQV